MFIWWDLSAFLWVVWLSVPTTGFTGEWLLGPCLRSPCDQLGGGKEKILIIASLYIWRDGGSTVSRQHGPRFLALTLSAQGFFCYVISEEQLLNKKLRIDRGEKKKKRIDRGFLTTWAALPSDHYQLLQSQRPFYSHTWHHIVQSGYLSNGPLWQWALHIIPLADFSSLLMADTTMEKTKWCNTNIKNSRTSKATTNKILKTHNI